MVTINKVLALVVIMVLALVVIMVLALILRNMVFNIMSPAPLSSLWPYYRFAPLLAYIVVVLAPFLIMVIIITMFLTLLFFPIGIFITIIIFIKKVWSSF